MAGVDQGVAIIESVMELPNFERLYLTGIGFENGYGVSTESASIGVFDAVILDFPGNAGPRTDQARPVLPARPAGTEAGTADTVDSKGVAATLDWWERIHIAPRAKIEFGNIISQVDEPYIIHSSFRRETSTLTVITNNATPGVTLPGISPGFIVDPNSSLLDPTTTDNCSDTLALATLVQLDVIAGPDGLPSFDTNIDFIFSPGNQVQLLVSGTRIVFLPQEYDTPVKETLAFLTDIITSLDGNEQRIALRKQPRQVFEVTYSLTENDRQRMQSVLMDWMDNVFGFPVLLDRLTLTGATSIGATTYPVLGADDVDLRVGGLAVVVTDSNVFDVINITAVTDTLITAGDAALNAYPAGTTIMPLRTVRILRSVAGNRSPVNLETFKITFEVTDNDTGALTGSTAAYSTFNSRVLLDDCNTIKGDMAENFKRRIYRIDNGTGLVSISSTWDRNKRSHQKGFVLRNRTDIINFRRLMLSLNGRQKAFYIPTFIEDLEVKAQLDIGADTMDIERADYFRFIQNRLPKTIFRITFNDGTNLVKTITSSIGVDATTERLTVDSTWPATRPVAEIVRVEFYELVRLDTDNIVVTHPRIGLAESRVPVIQVFDDNV